MAVGQSIAPSADKTMKIPGVLNPESERDSIDPVDYMGQSFIYQKWLDAKKKEIEQADQAKIDIATDLQRNDLPLVKENAAITLKKVEDFRSNPEYKTAFTNFEKEQSIAKEEWNATHGPVMGGRFQYKVYAIDKYNTDLKEAKATTDEAIDAMSNAKTKEDYNAAKIKYQQSMKQYEDIAKMNPSSDEFKSKYKDEIKEAVNKGATYASGWGPGGYSGTGAGSIAVRDQLLANVTGGRVGSQIAVGTKTVNEAMKDMGYTLKTDNTGLTQWVDNTGKVFSGAVPGSTVDRYGNRDYAMKLLDTSNTGAVLTDMVTKMAARGQKPTDEQLQETTQNLSASATIANVNQYYNLASAARMNPTAENISKAQSFASQYLSNEGQQQQQSNILGNLKTLVGIKEPSSTTTGPRTGSIMGADIYSKMTGGEFVKATKGGKEYALSDIAEQRRLAGKTGEFNLYNFPGFGGASALMSKSDEAKQFLYSTFGEPGKITEAPLQSVGSTIVEGRSLPIVQYGGREFVKPETGNTLIPLSVVTELKDLATKSGEYKNNTNLYNLENDYLKSFKEYSITKTPESQTNLMIATKNLQSDPSFTTRKAELLDTISTMGSLFAGTKLDSKGGIVTEPNIAKGILAFSSRPIGENALRMNLMAKEDLDRPVVNDTLKKMSNYGDPVLGIVRFANIVGTNAKAGNEVLALDPKSKGYDKIIDTLARASASKEATQFDQYVNVPESSKMGFVNPIDRQTQQFTQNFTIGGEVVKQPGWSVIGKMTPKDQVVTTTSDKIQIKQPDVKAITSETPKRVSNVSAVFPDLRGYLVTTPGVKKKEAAFSFSNVTTQRKNKKSKPKADTKHAKKKKDETYELGKLANNISKFTITGLGKKKKVK